MAKNKYIISRFTINQTNNQVLTKVLTWKINKEV